MQTLKYYCESDSFWLQEHTIPKIIEFLRQQLSYCFNELINAMLSHPHNHLADVGRKVESHIWRYVCNFELVIRNHPKE